MNDERNKPLRKVDRERVLQLSRALLRAVNESDVAGVTDVWATDGILMPPHHPSVSGRAAIEAYFVQRFRQDRFVFEFTGSAIDVAGDLATERVEYTASFFAADGSAPSFDRGKGVHVFRRQSNGEWRLAMDIWNSDTPTPVARQADGA
jgi:uncharacterized protein (TIGR02246 family)